MAALAGLCEDSSTGPDLVPVLARILKRCTLCTYDGQP